MKLDDRLGKAMRLRKKSGKLLFGLAVMIISGMGILWEADHIEGTKTQADRTEYGNENPASNRVDTISEGGSFSRETAVTDGNGNSSGRLLDLEDYSQAPADNGCPYYIKVNRQQNTVTIYALDKEGYYTEPVKAMVCSVGKGDATPTGTFRTQDRHSWCSLVGGVYGQYAYRIEGQIMFHSVPYYSMNKSDLETEEYNRLGEAASLGCIRLSVADAKWIYDNCPAGTIVTIYDSDYAGPLGKPAAEVLDAEDERSGWDPTDPDGRNPWNEGTSRILGAGDRTIERGCTWQMLCGVQAVDGSGKDITSQLMVKGTVDAMTAGDYPITYQLPVAEGEVIEAACVIRVEDTIAPVIELEEDTITLNRAEASEANCFESIAKYIRIRDTGEELEAGCLHMDISSLEGQREGRFTITVTAVDAAGNTSGEQEITVLLDRESPTIEEPQQKEFTAASEEELRQSLIAALIIEDNYSGVEEVGVSWTPEPGKDTYSLLVTAKDGFGNVSTRFFDDFIISYKSGE